MSKRPNLLESLPKSDPNDEIARRFHHELEAETYGLKADLLGRRLSYSQWLDSCVKSIEQTAAAHVAVDVELSIETRCHKLDELGERAIRLFLPLLESHTKTIGAAKVTATGETFTRRIKEIIARSKQQLHLKELARIDGPLANPQSHRVPKLELQNTHARRDPTEPSTLNRALGTLSARDSQLHELIGEENFRTLTNAQIIRDRSLRKKLREKFTAKPSGDALKCCLDRIRKAKGYSLSREIEKKRSSRP